MNMNITRRQLLKGAAITGVGMMLPFKFGVGSAYAFYQSPGLLKFGPGQLLRGVGPGQIPVIAPSLGLGLDSFAAPQTGVAHATINVQQFTDTLHPALGPTKLWGYHPALPAFPGAQKHLGGIIVVNRGVPLQLTFKNKLPAKAIIPVDATIPGANQAQNRTTVHLHGGLVPWISDGGPFDWWAPNGTHGLSFLNNSTLNPTAVGSNSGEYYYGNNQSARLLWYHDHAYGITRTNAYAGIATAYVIRDTFEGNMRNFGLPDYIELGGREIPIVIQDKVFVGANINAVDPTWVQKGFPSTPGSLWYPHVYEKNRWRLLGAGRNLPNPSIIAEMFGDTMLANGTVYPTVAVEARRYRFRILNACNARFLNLQLLVADPSYPDGILIVNGVAQNPAGPNWLVLGTEGGFLQNPVIVPGKKAITFDANTGNVVDYSLLTGNAERWDVIVDFSGFAGQEIILYSDSPAPFPGGDPRNDYYFGNPTNPVGPAPGYGPDTRQIMKFQVGAAVTEANLSLVQNANLNATVTAETIDPWNASVTTGTDPLTCPIYDTAGFPTSIPNVYVRRLTLNEVFDAYGRLTQMLGTDQLVGGKLAQPLSNPPTENVLAGSTEIWEIGNLTADTHPIHFHLVNVQILERYPFNAAAYTGGAFSPSGASTPPDATERGWKETVKMHPGTVTRVIMTFTLPQILKSDNTTLATPVSPRTGGNEYVWHCHILEHEEHDMMRPLVVT